MLPAVFISHGAPIILQTNAKVRNFLAALGSRLDPAAILVVNAHWLTGVATVGLPQIEPARAASALCRRASALLSKNGIENHVQHIDPHDFDLSHSAWLPLTLMYPDRGIPVGTLSVQLQSGVTHHHAVGRALRPLRAEGVLILGSGSLTHNPRDIDLNAPADYAAAWALEFVQWMTGHVERGDAEALLDYRRNAPFAEHSHPQEDHILPLFVALGAGSGGPGQLVHDGFSCGTISLAGFVFP